VGENQKVDDNPTPTATLVRGYLHGDVLHSRPAVINYNRFTAAPCRSRPVVFYGSNDGIIPRREGRAGRRSTASRKWGFIPTEFYYRLRAALPRGIRSSRRTSRGPISRMARSA
jgi:type IV pilus assembly protein PilY1